jgi:hypothetical protein
VTETMPTVTGPITGGRHGWSFGRPLADLDRYGYVENEYFLEGSATRYAPAAGASLDRDGRWQVEGVETRPYKTRIIVIRPADPASFNGTVVASWNNVSAGYDLYNGESLEILEGGYAFVGVTTQRVGVHGLPPTPLGLAAWDPERYGSLSIEGDDYSYDIFTQAARVIGRDRPRGPVDPLGGLDVRHVIAQGGSQSAGRLATYVNAVHPLAHAFDAYLLTIYFGSGSGLEVGDFVVNLASPQVNRRPALTGSNLLRDDIDALVMVVNSELEAIACYDVRQPDTDHFRYWEAAGTCHVSVQGMEARRPKFVRDFGSELAMPVAQGINEVPMIPLFDTAIHHLHGWLNGGSPPPIEPRISFTGDPAEIVRDEHGIAVGGIRLPQVEVPVAQNSAIPLTDEIYSRLGGSCVPFPPETVRALYGDQSTYLSRFVEAARAAEKDGVLLQRDVEGLIEEARSRPFP